MDTNPGQISTGLLEVKNLRKYFQTPRGSLHAVDDISFSIGRGKTLGMVGESGCGKSTTGRAILRLHEPSAGRVIFEGVDVTAADKKELHGLRASMQMIFQDPYASLNPRKTVARIIGEPLVIYKKVRNSDDYENQVRQLMKTVGLADRLYDAYPHELDGGRRQRIGVARALALNPKFIVCDEPVSALDVSIQAQILNLLRDLQDQFGLTYLFITHDLSVVKHISNDIAVMYLGQLVELAPSREMFRCQLHPYTRALLSAIPVPRVGARKKRMVLQGEITSPVDPKPGCRFAPRCPWAADVCRQADPPLREIQAAHWVACCRAEELSAG